MRHVASRMGLAMLAVGLSVGVATRATADIVDFTGTGSSGEVTLGDNSLAWQVNSLLGLPGWGVPGPL
jgi:hypothetical protein